MVIDTSVPANHIVVSMLEYFAVLVGIAVYLGALKGQVAPSPRCWSKQAAGHSLSARQPDLAEEGSFGTFGVLVDMVYQLASLGDRFVPPPACFFW